MPAGDDDFSQWMAALTQSFGDALSDPAVVSSTAAGLGAIGAVVVATASLRVDYVARRDQRVSALVSHFMSTDVANARDLLTQRESRFHTAECRHAAFILLWTIERVGADIDALSPSWATQWQYLWGRQPRQASGVEVLYANIARVTRCLNRYFLSDASNSYFDGSVNTANRVIASLPDWEKVNKDFPTPIVNQATDNSYRVRAIYKLFAPDNAFEPPKGTGVANRFQRWERGRRVNRQVVGRDSET
jgi:hypothetical protein